MRPPGRTAQGSQPAALKRVLLAALRTGFCGSDAAVGARRLLRRHPRTVVGDLRHAGPPSARPLSAQHNHSHHNLAHHPLVTLCPGAASKGRRRPRGVQFRVKRGCAPPSRQGPRRQRRRARAPASRSARPPPRSNGSTSSAGASALTAHDGKRHRAARGGCRRAGRNCHSRSSRCAGQTDETRHRAHRCSRRREARG